MAKFISKYRNMRVVLRPTRKELKTTGGEDIVIVHPALVAQFVQAEFDTTKEFPRLQQHIDCCDVHRLKSEEQLIHLLKGSGEYENSFNEYYEASPQERLSAKIKEAQDLAKEYGLELPKTILPGAKSTGNKNRPSPGQDARPSGSVRSPLRPIPPVEEDEEEEEEDRPSPGPAGRGAVDEGQDDDLGEEGEEEAVTVGEQEVSDDLDAKPFKELKEMFIERFGFGPKGASRAEIAEAIRRYDAATQQEG